MKQSTSHQINGPRDLLRAELLERCRRNPRYSLRAFAKALGISPTVLSLVLAGKRPLSRNALEKVALALGLAPEVKARLHTSRKVGGTPRLLPGFDSLSLDQFSLISDWHHYAILSLLETSGASIDPRWIARRLGVTPFQAKESVELLRRMGLIEQKSDGAWKQSTAPLKVENQVSTSATRKFHSQLLDRAKASLENDPFELRDFSSITLAIDPSLVAYARERIRQFRRELMSELETKAAPKEVYQLAVQIFPVSKPIVEKSKQRRKKNENG